MLALHTASAPFTRYSATRRVAEYRVKGARTRDCCLFAILNENRFSISTKIDIRLDENLEVRL